MLIGSSVTSFIPNHRDEQIVADKNSTDLAANRCFMCNNCRTENGGMSCPANLENGLTNR